MTGINFENVYKVIYLAEKTGYDMKKAISEYTALEIKYSPKPFNITKQAQDQALKQQQLKMLKLYLEEHK